MARPTLDPIRQFAFDMEEPIGSCRAKMCAVHHMLEDRDTPTNDVLNAVRQLVVETWNALDDIKARHGEAFKAAREART